MTFQSPSPLAETVARWVDAHRNEFASKRVDVRHDSLNNIERFAGGKAVVRFKHREVLMQIDLWGNGEADVMVLRKGRIKEFHRTLDESGSLVTFLTEQWREIRRYM